MSNFNPFAPQAEKPKSPQLQGFAAPQADNSPGLVQTLAPTVFNKAMDSEAAGKASDYLSGKAKDVWSSLTAPANPNVPVSELSNTMGTAISPSGMLGGGADAAIAAQQAAALSTTGAAPAALIGATPASFGGLAAGGAEAAIAAQQAAAATTAASAGTALTGASVASAAPMAAALGPFGIPILIGAGLYAANQGK
jgi:hypothetical protein